MRERKMVTNRKRFCSSALHFKTQVGQLWRSRRIRPGADRHSGRNPCWVELVVHPSAMTRAIDHAICMEFDIDILNILICRR
jgi:hypothetical protein